AGFGILLFIAQYLQLVLGLPPLAAGLWMLPSSAGFILGPVLAPVLARRIRPAVVMAAGLALAGAGLGLFTQLRSSAGLAILGTGSVGFSLARAQWTPWQPTWPSGPRHRSGPARRRRYRRPAPSSAGRWASRSSVSSAPASTAASPAAAPPAGIPPHV